MSAVAVPPYTTVIARDCSLLSVQNIPAGGGVPPAGVNFLGSFNKASMRITRGKTSIMGAADVADYNRATHFEGGTVTLEGFMRGTASSYAAVFASGSHGIVNFQDIATGDSWQVVVFLGEFGKEVAGKAATMDTITLSIEGVPFLNGSPLNLE